MLLHAALHLGAAAVLLGLLQPVAGQLASAPVALLSAASSSQCPVTVRYDVDLGREQNSTQVPIFVGFISISNNQNVSGTRPCCATHA